MLPEYWAVCGETFLIVTTWEGITGSWWVEVVMLGNTLHSTGQLPTTKNFLVQNISSTQVEKPYSEWIVDLYMW